jgi:hypothetical protein
LTFGRTRTRFVGIAIPFCGFRRVYSFAFVFDISDETSVIISGISYSLDTTIRKVDLVGTNDSTLFILIFYGLEVSSRICV